jgi:hypothetical protein
VGGSDVTGVRDPRPFAEIYDELVERTARQLGITPSEALVKHLRGEIPLKKRGGLVALCEGGAVKLNLQCEQSSFPLSALKLNHNLAKIRRRLAGGGVVRNFLRGVKGSGIDRALESLKSATNRAANREENPYGMDVERN